MPAWIGNPGALVELQCPSRSDQTVSRPASVMTTLGGNTVGQLAPGRTRSWTVELSTAAPGDAAAVLDLIMWGQPPWVWIDPLAAAANMMTPAGAALRPGTWRLAPGSTGTVAQTNGRRLVEGYTMTATGLLLYGATVIPQRTPVVTMGTYTCSIRALGRTATTPVTLDAWWVTTEGARLSKISTSAVLWGTDLGRLSVTGRAPGRAAYVEMEVRGATIIAAPQVTATAFPVRWSPGLGSMTAMPVDIDTSALSALTTSQDRGAVLASYSFKVVDLQRI